MVKINGKQTDADGKTIRRLIEEGGYKAERVAVELNEKIVPKADYDTVTAADGDTVEIVGFVGGG